MYVCLCSKKPKFLQEEKNHTPSPHQIGPWYHTLKLGWVHPTTCQNNAWHLSYTKCLKALSNLNVSETDPKESTDHYLPMWQLEYLVKGYQRYQIEQDSETNIAENPQRT